LGGGLDGKRGGAVEETQNGQLAQLRDWRQRLDFLAGNWRSIHGKSFKGRPCEMHDIGDEGGQPCQQEGRGLLRHRPSLSEEIPA